MSSRGRLVSLTAGSLVVGGIAGPLVLAAEIGRVQFQYGIFIGLYSLLVFITGVAVAAVAALLLAVGRMRWPQARPFVVVGACLAGSTFASCQVARHFSVGCAELQAQGNQLVAVIEQSFATSGAYPDSLQELGLVISPTRFGPWRYGHKESEFWLSVGDYGRDELELTYTSTEGWYCDR